MEQEKWIERLMQKKIVAICRNVPLDRIADMADALYAGGIRFLEITFNQKEDGRTTGNAIRAVKKRMDNKMHIGAGTVFSCDQVDIAMEAGAEFMLSPHVSEQVIAYTKRRGCISIPGAFTPTEIVAAWNAGADIVKLFPAGNLGEAYVKAVRAPVNHIPLMGVGGIRKRDLKTFLAAGIQCFGIGANIVDLSLIESGRYQELKELAESYVAVMADI